MLELFPGNRDWSIQALRLVAEAQFGGGDFSEIVDTARRIDQTDSESWIAEWDRIGSEVMSLAESAATAGHWVSASQAAFRAFNYFRTGESFFPPADPRRNDLYRRGTAAFQLGAESSPHHIERVEVPFGDAVMPGYFCSTGSGEPGPAVLYVGGADSWAEELYFLGGNQIVARGMHMLIVDTPGRGSLLRFHGVTSRPDYEVPIAAAMDYLLARPEVDPSRVGLVGDSMGGYYAPRAAAFEHRIKACVAWAGCFNVLQNIYEFYAPIQEHLQWVVGAQTDAEARKILAEFTMEGLADQITCPLLIVHGVNDFIMDPRGAKQLHAGAGGSSELRMWGEGGRGGSHLSYDDISIVLPFMFDWLADQLDSQTEGGAQ